MKKKAFNLNIIKTNCYVFGQCFVCHLRPENVKSPVISMRELRKDYVNPKVVQILNK